VNPQPKPVKKISCRLPDCPRPRYGTARLCHRHWQEQARLKREESRRRKLDRKLKSKKFQDGERKKLINKCDAVFSLLIRGTWRKCARCFKTPPAVTLQCSHLFSRQHLAIRWDERNAVAKCGGCHIWWGGNPLEAQKWLIESGTRTKEEMDALWVIGREPKQWTTSELKTLLADLQEKLSKL